MSADVGGADADMILGDCLIDLKATIDPKVTSEWRYQLLGYVLLDYADYFKIHTVALHLARQGVLLRWSLADLLPIMMGGESASRIDLPAEFRDVARKAKER